ncbi:tRNA dihydrouridine(20/20a) synthase DusA [Parvularcula sp. IMCC14364]|uniref:tRNA dihydrouridine(20/20a) synthase DusA n=1 Tax=Parvularcula sp. IMCC14364 TaxID=3067902 RepID=UPI003556895E
MIDWTDRHCRFFHRQLTKRARLYTEMIVAEAILRGDREYLLGFDTCEHPVAIQLGGSDPARLAEAAGIAESYGYDEINLNVGCPSDKVQSGTFGACLMRDPALVAECVAAMRAAVSVPVTVKCRLGVDDQDPEESLFTFVRRVAETGCDTFIVHARKAWLQGLSPKENRTIPPLDYEIVARLKQENPALQIILNGGITSLDQAGEHLGRFDGVMLGRAAYENPYLLADVDRVFFGGNTAQPDRRSVVEAMIAYSTDHLEEGGKVNMVTRHMIGLFHGQPGAKTWRQHLTVESCKSDADAGLLRDALNRLPAAAFEVAA